MRCDDIIQKEPECSSGWMVIGGNNISSVSSEMHVPVRLAHSMQQCNTCCAYTPTLE